MQCTHTVSKQVATIYREVYKMTGAQALFQHNKNAKGLFSISSQNLSPENWPSGRCVSYLKLYYKFIISAISLKNGIKTH